MARGDHIYVNWLGYSHHGIDMSDGDVIHFDFHPWLALTRKLATIRKPDIRRVSLDQFTKGRPVVVRRYQECDDVETVIERAKSRLGEQGYHLFNNNCEHFAVWCKTGESTSTQVNDFMHAAQPLTMTLPAATAIMRTARKLPGRLRPAAYGAALAMTAGAFAHRYVENRVKRAMRRES